MSRPAKKFKDPKKQAAHEKSLARRRAAHLKAKGLKNAVAAAAEGAESEADFEKLVDIEKRRMETAPQTNGRTNGSPKTIRAARENLTVAFDLMGGVPALVAWGRKNQTEFYRLWARLIPKESMEISATLPLEALLSKLNGRESLSVGEAARQVGEEVLIEARAKVIEHDERNPDAEDPWAAEDEETLQ